MPKYEISNIGSATACVYRIIEVGNGGTRVVWSKKVRYGMRPNFMPGGPLAKAREEQERVLDEFRRSADPT